MDWNKFNTLSFRLLLSLAISIILCASLSGYHTYVSANHQMEGNKEELQHVTETAVAIFPQLGYRG
ncbi:hypothetical protein ACFPES_08370 [Paenibacillus sp. GCM10023248]|uniref:hypothetical protein n=1 Tax=Bacillales TaxID=1385 RepID=UPI002379C8E6|nr:MULTISPECIES: hypothetical protein [Bacillales]MDD9267049.1 hypothetical protein [Paenibacillus sp. MAHUQ-63]MDR6881250.1 hypothetical protein [Bacillus sp. 3255]